MSWQLLMIFQNLLSAVFAINSRQIANDFKHATMPFNLLVFGVIAGSGSLYALFHGAASIDPHIFVHYLGFFIFAGICFAITNVLSYVVYNYVDAAIGSLLATLNIVATVVLSTILLREGLTIRQIVGTILLLIGMELVLTINFNRAKHHRLIQAVMLSILAAMFFALATTTEKYLLNHVPLSTYLVFGWGFQFLGVCLLALIFGRVIKANYGLLRQPKFYRLAFPAGMLRMISGMMFVYSLKLSNNLSIISALLGLKVILVAVLGAYFLKERDYLKRKFEAALTATAGIAIIYWK